MYIPMKRKEKADKTSLEECSSSELSRNEIEKIALLLASWVPISFSSESKEEEG